MAMLNSLSMSKSCDVTLVSAVLVKSQKVMPVRTDLVWSGALWGRWQRLKSFHCTWTLCKSVCTMYDVHRLLKNIFLIIQYKTLIHRWMVLHIISGDWTLSKTGALKQPLSNPSHSQQFSVFTSVLGWWICLFLLKGVDGLLLLDLFLPP